MKLLDTEVKRRDKRLPADVAEAVAAYAAKATWPAGFVVYQRGAFADGMFIVLRGRIVLRSRVKAARAFVPALAREEEPVAGCASVFGNPFSGNPIWFDDLLVERAGLANR